MQTQSQTQNLRKRKGIFGARGGNTGREGTHGGRAEVVQQGKLHHTESGQRDGPTFTAKVM